MNLAHRKIFTYKQQPADWYSQTIYSDTTEKLLDDEKRVKSFERVGKVGKRWMIYCFCWAFQ